MSLVETVSPTGGHKIGRLADIAMMQSAEHNPYEIERIIRLFQYHPLRNPNTRVSFTAHKVDRNGVRTV